MNIQEVKSRWNEVKMKLKERYGMLTEEDLNFAFGKEGELIFRLQQKLGKTKADVMKIIGEA